MELSNTFVVLLGLGTVFVGLVCIVFLCMIMSAFVRTFSKNNNDAKKTPTAVQTPPAAAPTAPIADRQAIIATSCAVIAEELGEDVKNIKVVSFKRV